MGLFGKAIRSVNALIALIDALAWPASVLSIAFLFRHEVRGVLTRLGEFKYAGVEMTFRDDLRDAEVLAGAIPNASSPPEPTPAARVQLEVGLSDSTELAGTLVGHEAATATTVLIAGPPKSHSRATPTIDRLREISGHAPRDGVRETWAELQQTLLSAAAGVGDRRAPAPVGVEGAIRFLIERGWINSIEGQLIDRLHRLAEVVDRRDSPPIAPDEARRFVSLAAPILLRLIGIGSTE